MLIGEFNLIVSELAFLYLDLCDARGRHNATDASISVKIPYLVLQILAHSSLKQKKLFASVPSILSVKYAMQYKAPEKVTAHYHGYLGEGLYGVKSEFELMMRAGVIG